MSAFASAFIDNIPFVATLIPLIKDMGQLGLTNLDPMWWSLALGACLGGNGTLIGASANVVGTSVSAKGGYPIGWGRYCKYCVPATILVMAVSILSRVSSDMNSPARLSRLAAMPEISLPGSASQQLRLFLADTVPTVLPGSRQCVRIILLLAHVSQVPWLNTLQYLQQISFPLLTT